MCVALYVGSDTKVILNSAKFSAKKSRLMSVIDEMVFGIFFGQIILCIVFSLFNILFENSYDTFTQLVGPTKFWINSASWWLLMTYFVPISLIVTMEMIKLFQGSLI
jgi:phospholipid-transporting ATPase